MSLQPDDLLKQVPDDNESTLPSSREQSRMAMKQGVWVFYSGGGTILPEETDLVLEEIRNSRNQQ